MAQPLFYPKNLGNGQLTASKTTLYTVPLNATAIVRSIVLVNTTASTVLVNFYANFGGASRRVLPLNLELTAGAMMEQSISITLEAGHILEGEASMASVIDFIINGVESTP